MTRSVLAILALALVAGGTAAQQQPERCSGDEYRQFDFWIGDWEVADADGNAQGSNKIESILGGCVLRESWADLFVGFYSRRVP